MATTDIRERIAELGERRVELLTTRDNLHRRRRALRARKRMGSLSKSELAELKSIPVAAASTTEKFNALTVDMQQAVIAAVNEHHLSQWEVADLAQVERPTVLGWLGVRKITQRYVPTKQAT